MAVEHHQRSTSRCPLGEPRNAPLGSRCGEMTELERREPAINHPPHLLRDPNGICETELFGLKELRKRVRRYDTSRPWGFMLLCGSMKSWIEWVRPKVGKDTVCIFIVWYNEMKMRWCLSIPGCPKYILSIAQSTSMTPVYLYTRRCILTMYLEAVIEPVRRCNCRPTSSELRDALGGCDRAKLQMHLEAVIERVWMQLETKIEWTQRCTGRPWLSEFGHALWGRGQVNS